MRPKLIRYFFFSAGTLLLATAVAKLVSSVGSARILQMPDPLFGISFSYLFRIVGGIELVIAIVCIFGKRIRLKTELVIWVATSFLAYRLGLLLVDYHKPCSCLGNLTDALHMSPQTTDTVAKIILGYLLLGSYITVFWLWKEKQKASLPGKATNSVS